MPKSKSRARVAVLEPAADAVEPAALWSVALLRIAMELRRADAPALDEIITGVVARMGIPEGQFRKYLSQQLGELSEIARAK